MELRNLIKKMIYITGVFNLIRTLANNSYSFLRLVHFEGIQLSCNFTFRTIIYFSPYAKALSGQTTQKLTYDFVEHTPLGQPTTTRHCLTYCLWENQSCFQNLELISCLSWSLKNSKLSWGLLQKTPNYL